MKIWIGTDMEGIAGVVDREHTHRTGREHDRARGWMTDEVNAAVAGCFAGGASAVTVTDGHGTCRNIVPERLDPRARLASIELRFHHPMYTGLAAMVPGCRTTGEWSAAFTGESFLDAFGAFTAMCGVTGIAHYQHQ